MVDVAAEAGVSVGVLYQRFTDKRAFFEVIVDTLAVRIERDLNEFFQEAEKEADEAWDLSKLIERVVATLVEMVARDVGFYLVLITVGEEVPGAIGRIAAVDRHRAQRLHAFAAGRGLIDRAAIDEERVFFALATAIRMLLVTATVDRKALVLNLNDHTQQALFQKMVRIRRFEEAAGRMMEDNRAPGITSRVIAYAYRKLRGWNIQQSGTVGVRAVARNLCGSLDRVWSLGVKWSQVKILPSRPIFPIKTTSYSHIFRSHLELVS